MFLVPYRSRPSRDEYIDAEVVVEETEQPDDPVTIYVVPPPSRFCPAAQLKRGFATGCLHTVTPTLDPVPRTAWTVSSFGPKRTRKPHCVPEGCTSLMNAVHQRQQIRELVFC